VPRSNIICLGRNYRAHGEESARTHGGTDRPTFFTKAVTTVIGPWADVPYRADVSTQLDWEVELAVVIGKPARGVTRADALAHVFGYTVLNDVSARNVQYGYNGQFFLGKSLDGTCPMGPWIVTADEIGDPQSLCLRLTVNGVVKQEANTADMTYGVDEIIEILSRFMTLEAGQIIATGTPAGVGDSMQPPEYLQPGDLMESSIDRIGTLSNRVVQVSDGTRVASASA
jgi:2-keto-4-pentenoate hydratase/2-oxohepta-3-ene-1,7-dioic acid hydratase in catechol pathway